MIKAPVKENETNAIQEVITPEEQPSKSHTELLRKTIEEQNKEINYMKTNYVPLEKFTSMHRNFKESEADRKYNMERYRETHEKLMKETSVVRNLDAELENTREQLRKETKLKNQYLEENKHFRGLIRLWV